MKFHKIWVLPWIWQLLHADTAIKNIFHPTLYQPAYLSGAINNLTISIYHQYHVVLS
ncbi:hypothetical protein HMP0015_3056 [Acinetobacter haemolyticus ATCC 19194]|uniref:Uncharacterized protein n=1 Tax=Acinetobacter haemolyticus ATCC 19194 TaxID=707232 RepID=D4XTL4_ACIHA|nr:hypothetical protein HMP0015_3056 [Acinetobacter haemolyticus ATCC 19194]